MKTRFGFVSNSSSTSFIVGLPKNYNPTDNEIEKAILDNGRAGIISVNQIRKAIIKLKECNGLYMDGNENAYFILSELLIPFIIGEIDTSSDAGIIINVFNGEANVERIKKLAESYEGDVK